MPEEPTASSGAQPPESEGPTTPPIEVDAQAVEVDPPTPPKVETPKVESVKPPASAASSGSPQSQDTLNQVSQQAQQYWQKAQPVLKEKGTQALLWANNFTNHFLDNVWPKLSNQAISAIPASAKTKFEEQKAKAQPTLDKLQPVWEKGVVPFWQKVVVPLWMKGLTFLRQKLPDNLKVLTDRFLTILVLGLFYLVYSFFSGLSPDKPSVAKTPVPSKPVLTRPVPPRPTPPPIVQASPKVAPTIKPTVSPAVVPPSPRPNVAVAPVAPPPSPKPTIAAEPKVVPPAPKVAPPAPATPPPVAPPPVAIAPKPEVSPTLDLAAIQAELASAMTGIGDNLIGSVKALDTDHRLQVVLGSSWYDLNFAEQNQAAQSLWEKSQKLRFDQVELRDGDGALIARNPVVGSKMIILRRLSASGNA